MVCKIICIQKVVKISPGLLYKISKNISCTILFVFFDRWIGPYGWVSIPLLLWFGSFTRKIFWAMMGFILWYALQLSVPFYVLSRLQQEHLEDLGIPIMWNLLLILRWHETITTPIQRWWQSNICCLITFLKCITSLEVPVTIWFWFFSMASRLWC